MTSRERLQMALNHEEPDRIPIDLGSARSTGINAIAYRDLKKHLGIRDGETRVFDVKQLMALPEDEILQRFGVDVVMLPSLRPSIGLKLENWKEWKLPVDGGKCVVPGGFEPTVLENGDEIIVDGDGRELARRPVDGLYFDEMYHPLEEAEDEADIDKLPLPQLTEEAAEFAKERAKDLFENTEFAISGATSFSLFEKGTKDFGYENFLVLLYTEPELVEYYLDKLTDTYIVMMQTYMDAVGDYVQVVQNNDDFGMQTGLIVPPDIYRNFFKERHAKIIRAIKEKNKDVRIFLHSCGSIQPIMHDLIEAGFEIFNPVQWSAADMDPQTLKNEFGKKCTFWGGGVDTQDTLVNGSVQDVVEEAKRMIDIFAPGGGFVFNAVHNIQSGVAPEKIVALFDTAMEYGTKGNYK